MNPWPFIIGAYVVGIGGTSALMVTVWAAMRRAEAEVDKLGHGE